MKRRSLGLAALAACLPALSAPNKADGWPTGTVRLIVPFSAGGATDATGRMLAQQLGDTWKQTVIVDNRAGAGTVIGTDAVAKSKADGYTIGMVVSAHVINPSLRSKMPYDTLKDFSAISQIGMQHMIIAANPSFPANNIPELIALAKKNPGVYSYASSGAGTALHLSFEMLKVKAGIDITHVPYKGGAPAQQDVMGGQVPLLVDIYQSSAPLIKSGRLKLIGLFSPKASPDVPGGVPVADTVPGVSSMSIFGLVGPASMPPEIVDKISRDIARLSKSSDWIARMHELGVEPVGSTPAEFETLIRTDIAKWAPIVKASGATVD